MLFGELMKKRREELELSQSDLGTKQMIYAYESEKKSMSLKQALKFAKRLKIPKNEAIVAHLNSYLFRNGLKSKISDLIK